MNKLSNEQLIKYAEEKVTNLSKVIDQSAFTNIKDRLIEELQLAQIGLDALRELKGEQVPVAWTSQRSLETKNKIVAFTDDMSALDYGTANGWTDIVELFTAPQKPVVCLKSGYLHKSEVIDAIEAAGCVVSFSDERLMQDMSGIVKDGE